MLPSSCSQGSRGPVFFQTNLPIAIFCTYLEDIEYWFSLLFILNSPKLNMTKSECPKHKADISTSHVPVLSIFSLVPYPPLSVQHTSNLQPITPRSYLWNDGLWCLTAGQRWVGEWDLYVSVNRGGVEGGGHISLWPRCKHWLTVYLSQQPQRPWPRCYSAHKTQTPKPGGETCSWCGVFR